MKKTKGAPARVSAKKHPVHVRFPGKILMVGFGSIGQGVLPLILRHLGVDRSRITIIAADARGEKIAKRERVAFHVEPLTEQNYRRVIRKYISKGDFLLNLSVDVDSISLVKYCQENGILYLDTVIEPWQGVYDDPDLSLTERSNYGLREKALACKAATAGGPTAVIAHGANPGIVSHFVKRALMNIARDTGDTRDTPKTQHEWAALMRDLGVKSIHIAEYDSQKSRKAKKIGCFENTWSVFGFYAEGINQPCELGWGTHEKYWPKGAQRHAYGCGAGIYLDRPGALTLVRTWTPQHGAFLGRAVTHNESISIADYFSIRGTKRVTYRPTVHYAYRSCDASLLSIEECLGNNSQLQSDQRILLEDIESGMDELGVLLMGHKRGAYWYGSQLTIEDTRRLAPYQNATGLQVTAGVLGGMVWAIENPNRGIVEADEIDFERIMQIIEPYMGKMTGAYTDWTPLRDRDALFSQAVDETDPWQFRNFLFDSTGAQSTFAQKQGALTKDAAPVVPAKGTI